MVAPLSVRVVAWLAQRVQVFWFTKKQSLIAFMVNLVIYNGCGNC
jgi:hypothetical protein